MPVFVPCPERRPRFIARTAGNGALLVLCPEMLGNADGKSGGRNHHRGLGGTCIRYSVSLDVPEALLLQHMIRLVKIVHIHPDDDLVL